METLFTPWRHAYITAPPVVSSGFNLGMNLGSSAGAGVPGHYHFHLVPRWNGDTNYMSVLAEVRLVPEALGQAHERLRALFLEEDSSVGIAAP